MTEILVTGGTGQLGRRLVPRLVGAGHTVRVLSRRSDPDIAAGAKAVQGDLVSGAGIPDAVDGIDQIVHCASGTGDARSLTYRSARRTDVAATAHLLEAAKRRGSPHVLYISIVGVDRIPLGYYRAKLETEHVIEASELPFTILRTTQWHTLAHEFCRRLARGPLVVLPKGLRSQLLDADEAAERMATLAEERPHGHASNMGGPETLTMRAIVEAYLDAVGVRKRVIEVPVPGKTMKAFRAGYNLAPDHVDGKLTWRQWLEAKA